jgi:coproporphyrinogen III oxidase
MVLNRADIEVKYQRFQREFVAALNRIDPQVEFVSDVWERPEGGGGISMVASGDGVIEKAAVNFSSVAGETPAQISERLTSESSTFAATGVSIIVHPANPHAPTFHSNIRYFETDSGRAWFGGGADLTPYYLYEVDVIEFHSALAEVCDRHELADYAAWKQECDRYFRLPHRGEARGVGGIFFDHLEGDMEQTLRFQLDFAETLTDVYPRILDRRVDHEFTESQRQWQLYRRGRYVEFNLLWDRGTKFGIETGGRAESILASLPPLVRFEYGYEPAADSPESRMLSLLRDQPRRWVPDSLLGTPATKV